MSDYDALAISFGWFKLKRGWYHPLAEQYPGFIGYPVCYATSKELCEMENLNAVKLADRLLRWPFENGNRLTSQQSYDLMREAATALRLAAAPAASPVTTEQLDKLQFGKALHERPAASEGVRVGDDKVRRGIYIASKTKHAARWIALRASGTPIISTWIDEAGEGQSADLNDLWVRCIRESSSCKVLIAYREPDEMLKGGWVEIGAALQARVPVYAVGLEQYTIAKYHGIQHFQNIESAFAAALTAPPLPADEDCEDQGLFATERCTICRVGFDQHRRPIYPKLERRGKFWCCPRCGSSYGENPHPNCPALTAPPLPADGVRGADTRGVESDEVFFRIGGVIHEARMRECYGKMEISSRKKWPETLKDFRRQRMDGQPWIDVAIEQVRALAKSNLLALASPHEQGEG